MFDKGRIPFVILDIVCLILVLVWASPGVESFYQIDCYREVRLYGETTSGTLLFESQGEDEQNRELKYNNTQIEDHFYHYVLQVPRLDHLKKSWEPFNRMWAKKKICFECYRPPDHNDLARLLNIIIPKISEPTIESDQPLTT